MQQDLEPEPVPSADMFPREHDSAMRATSTQLEEVGTRQAREALRERTGGRPGRRAPGAVRERCRRWLRQHTIPRRRPAGEDAETRLAASIRARSLVFALL